MSQLPETLQQKLARLRAGMEVTPKATELLKEVVKEVISPPIPVTPTSPAVPVTPNPIDNKPLSPAQLKIQQLLLARKAATTVPNANLTKTDTLANSNIVAMKALVSAVSNTLPDTQDVLNNQTSHVTELNSLSNNLLDSESQGVDKTGAVITYNEQQLKFIQTASRGESCILIGAAGTGKTTCMRGAVSAMLACGIIPSNSEMGDHKYLPPVSNGVVLVSYTRRAVSNLRKAMSEELKGNCLTIHSLLEYEPVYYDIIDPETGNPRQTMRFEPTRHATRQLPNTIKVCIIDESSMVSVELFEELRSALPSDCVFIFLGDIQQLPPVFGSAILGYKMLELVTVELTEVYRQALESPIIRLAHRILSGKPIPVTEYADWKYPNQLTIHPWKKKLTAETATITLAKFLTVAYDNNQYSPMDDMILIPFNKSCGTIELNKHIANHIARKENRVTHEIIAGYNRIYLSVGDKVLYEKEDAIVVDIVHNNSYHGVLPQQPSNTLDYWGFQVGDANSSEGIAESAETELDMLLSMAVAGEDSEDRVRKGSHIVTVKLLDSDQEVKVDSAATLNGLLLSYAVTVHKSQGSEFRKVFFLLHQSHATMIYRELMYTAVTRAREELYIICEPESFTKGINSQRIQGNSLAEKAQYFMGKLEASNKLR